MNLNEEKLMTIVLAARVSEKTANLQQDHNQYVFKVCSAATKSSVKQAIEKLFRVAVDKVRVCNVKGKKRKFGRIEGRKKDWKKAYVTLEKGQAIDLGVA